MATISSPGLGSGLDVNGIITKLMQVESQPLTTLTKKEADYQAKLSAFGTLQGALSSLQSAARTLQSASTFTSKSATASDTSVLTASATSTAATGSTSITVTQLAKFNAIRSNTDYAATSDTFTTGTLSISVGGAAATNITIDGTNNTLSGIRQAINDAGAGVTATIVNDGTTNRLVVTSQTSGSDGEISIGVTDAGSGGTNALGDLDTLLGNIQVTQTADDAQLTVNGIAITRSSNVITDAIEGVTLNLTKGTPASPATTTLTVTSNTTAVTTALDAFVKAYNDTITQVKGLTAYDAVNKKASILTGDGTVRSVQTQLNNLVWSNVTGVGGGISGLADVGISVQKDGTLKLDSAKLAETLGNPDNDVAALFTQSTTNNEGIGVRFTTLLDGLIGTGGLLEGKTDGLTASITEIQKRTDAMNLRLDQIEKRYRSQFTALDTLIASMQKTSQFLTQQLANLPTTSSK